MKNNVKKKLIITLIGGILIYFGQSAVHAGNPVNFHLTSVEVPHLPGNPNAIQTAVELYRFLDSLSDADSDTGKIISGQWFGASFAPGKASFGFELGELIEIRKRSGKWLGMISGWICPGVFGHSNNNDPIEDCMWYENMLNEYELVWKNGGILHVAASFFAPLEDRYAERLEEGVTVSVDSILKEGTASNLRWRAICDKMVEFFKVLESKNIPVIFRPFAESYIQGYWYSHRNTKLGPENFKRLYIDTWNYITIENGCNNILWDFQGSSSEAAFPGRPYVDIITSYSDYLAWGGNNQFNCSPNEPLPYANAELGDYGISQRTRDAGKEEIPWNDWMEWARNNCPRMMFYIKWWRDWGPVKSATSYGEYANYDTGYNTALANPYILTRDEIDFPLLPESPSLPYSNDFNTDADGWIYTPGNWFVHENVFKCLYKKKYNRTVFGSTDWKDYAVEATVKLTSDNLAQSAGIMAHCATFSIYYSLSISSGNLSLKKHFNDQVVYLGSWNYDFETGTAYRLRIEFINETINGYIDTGSGLEKKISVADASIPFGAIGLIANLATAEFDDLSVETISGVGIRTINNPARPVMLDQNYPNPFVHETQIDFTVTEISKINIKIYDACGRMIRHLLKQNLYPASHSVIWNGKNENGNPVPPGIYFCRMEVENKTGYYQYHIRMVML